MEGESKMARMTTRRERKSLKRFETLYIREKQQQRGMEGWRLSGSSAGRRLVGFRESAGCGWDVDVRGSSGMELT